MLEFLVNTAKYFKNLEWKTIKLWIIGIFITALMVAISVQTYRVISLKTDLHTASESLKQANQTIDGLRLYQDALIDTGDKSHRDYLWSRTVTETAKKVISDASVSERNTKCPVLSRTLDVLRRSQKSEQYRK